MAAKENIQFVPFTSYMDIGFLSTLTKNKLEIYCLDDKPVSIHGFFSNGDAPNLPSRLSLDFSAFNEIPQTPPRNVTINGQLHMFNTIESFKSCNKLELMFTTGEKIYNEIKSGAAEDDPTQLLQFILLVYCDMKKYHYYYWFGFPALCFPDNAYLLEKPVTLDKSILSSKIKKLEEVLENSSISKEYFLMYIVDDDISLHHLFEFSSLHSKPGKLFLVFTDPSTLDTHPGWPLRNFLALAALRWSKLTKTFDVLCLRDRIREGTRSINHSLILSIELEIDETKNVKIPNCVGWEKNERQKMGPRMMNLSSSMDPVKLSESSVDLNLKLMKWRLVPELDLDKIMHTKCLLLGSGTLGCNVARQLMAWGVRTITLVDYGKVSYSNPVRQTLFKFNDCLHGGKAKAETAAASLKEIFPGVNSTGLTLSIPMPGHVVDQSSIEQVRKDVEKLEQLITDHDVIFLLMDTRESRWLPTVIAAAKSKLVINAALGFDTYLVLRHGLKSPEIDSTKPFDPCVQNFIPGNKLGCYFCNDVVAPGDSTRDRTLDQQCTVTRPGVSMIAAAMAVELMVSIVHHPSGGNLPALTSTREDSLFTDQSTTLGVVPHQIRGFLSQFCHILPASHAFDKCTACSDQILNKYQSEGFEFLLKVFNQPSVLEDLTGLTELHDETQTAEVWELSD